ncbi:MAG: phage terminase large subunit family protein [Patescibacteria group bacterium]
MTNAELQEKREKASILYWIKNKKIKTESDRKLEFRDHRFLLDIYTDESDMLVIRKASQVGASTMQILRALHAARYWGINQIYTLPTVDDVGEFVRSKVNRIVKVNPSIMEGVSHRDVDSIEQKQIGKGFLFFKGTHTEKEAIMLSSDRNIHDELDKSKPEVIRDYLSRLGYSEIRGQHYFSTPTIPNSGVDHLFQQSDQKHWRFNCPHCGHKQHMDWEENLDREKEIYVCVNCRKEITSFDVAELGKWEAKYPNRRISGYWISQMMCPWRTAADLLQEERDAEDLQYFYNFVLGLPYLSAEQKIPQSLFLKNLTGKNAEGGKWNVMGSDTGLINHVIIGNEDGIFWMGRLEDHGTRTRWQQMEELIEFYDIRVCVVDAMPYTEEALALARKYPHRVYVNFYKDDPKMLQVVRWNDEKEGKENVPFEDEIKVLTSRNRIIDDTIGSLRRGNIPFAIPKDSPSFQLLIKHAQTMYARTVTDKLGQEKREWASTTGEDHFWHALLYWHVALKKRLKYEPNK